MAIVKEIEREMQLRIELAKLEFELALQKATLQLQGIMILYSLKEEAGAQDHGA